MQEWKTHTVSSTICIVDKLNIIAFGRLAPVHLLKKLEAKCRNNKMLKNYLKKI